MKDRHTTNTKGAKQSRLQVNSFSMLEWAWNMGLADPVKVSKSNLHMKNDYAKITHQSVGPYLKQKILSVKLNFNLTRPLNTNYEKLTCQI